MVLIANFLYKRARLPCPIEQIVCITTSNKEKYVGLLCTLMEHDNETLFLKSWFQEIILFACNGWSYSIQEQIQLYARLFNLSLCRTDTFTTKNIAKKSITYHNKRDCCLMLITTRFVEYYSPFSLFSPKSCEIPIILKFAVLRPANKRDCCLITARQQLD